MNIDHFDLLLAAALIEPNPQRLLLVFCTAEAAPDGGAGLTLAPVMCVDKADGEVQSFAQLSTEAAGMGAHWDVLVASTLAGSAGAGPRPEQAEQGLRRMLASIRGGSFHGMLAFDRQGWTLVRDAA
ncbi:MAG: hypothetical protein K0S54_3202 [Alphaproteobacteria bacterium]|jgi:hypothetical protein|nr:hypothetical protein [Alphaproteobacteria bacterium]